VPETFLILLAGGVLLAAAVPRLGDVTLQWLRLCGVIALAMAGVALFFYFTREAHPAELSAALRRVQVGLLFATAGSILAQLAFVQVGWRRTQRALAVGGGVVAVLAGSNLLHEMMIPYGTAVRYPPKVLSMAMQTTAAAGAGALAGLALMDMLLGHAYLTAAKMTIAPFRRLNLAVAGVLAARVLLAGVATAMNSREAWMRDGFFIITRWLVGLLVPAVFLYMAHDCIRRRSTQSATGILYVAGVLIFIGEIVALYLVRATGLPF
jgi:hypothetical protein